MLQMLVDVRVVRIQPVEKFAVHAPVVFYTESRLIAVLIGTFNLGPMESLRCQRSSLHRAIPALVCWDDVQPVRLNQRRRHPQVLAGDEQCWMGGWHRRTAKVRPFHTQSHR